VSAVLPKPADPSEGIVLQYEARLQDGLDCGGAYLKFVTADDSFSPEGLNGDTPYTVMFGPDKCGGTNKVHVIFRHKSPLDGSIEEKHLMAPPSIVDDKKPHLYTLVVKPDNTYEVLVDSESKKSGSLFDDFEPPFNPPAEIDDPEDSKPADWVDEAQIADPEATKPDDWDEDAPMEIVDTEATKPEGWLDDEPDTVVDPESKQPDDWDEDEDGTWEGPIVKNPKCEKAPGCGEWTPPMKQNPDYKGKWYPPMIDNPAYKGVWAPRKIPNPKFFEDKTPLASIGKIGAVALEIWTMSAGLLIDNILIAKDDKTADDFAEKSWRGKFDHATKAAAKEAADNIPKTPPFVVQKLYDLLDVEQVKPYADTLRPYVEFFEANVMVLYIVLVAVPALVIAILMSALFGGKTTPMDKAAELTERRQQRFERERRLQGRAGCAGLLQVLRHAYGDEAEACSPEVFDASMRFVEAKRVRHVKEILKFNMKAQLVAMLPNMDDEKAARLGDALSTQALVSYEVGPPLSPSGFTSPSARSSPTKSPEAAAKS